MPKLTDQQAIEYLHRCYTAVDGLWFMKLEEWRDFETALDLDTAVWKVMPKIQSRTLRTMIPGDGGIDHLRLCIAEKLTLDGFLFDIVDEDDGFVITISRCPWHDFMKKAGREHLSEKIGNRICDAEYGTWAAEFDGDLICSLHERICSGCDTCTIRFQHQLSA